MSREGDLSTNNNNRKRNAEFGKKEKEKEKRKETYTMRMRNQELAPPSRAPPSPGVGPYSLEEEV